MNAIRPFSFLSGHEVLGTSCDTWMLDDISSGHEPRSFRAPVMFQKQFQSEPLVHLGLAGFDIGNADCARVTVTAENVTPTGFEIVVSTWLHTKMWRVAVSWIALGS